MEARALADELEMDDKKLRAWLRETYPELAPGQGRRWDISTVMAAAARSKFSANTR